MIAERYCVEYGGCAIEFDVVRRARTTLEIAVEPDATVVVVAPEDAGPEVIIQKVRKRAAWIQRQQRFFGQFMPCTPERRFVAGETHLYLGRQYRLKVLSDPHPGVKMIRGYLVVYSPAPRSVEVTRDLLAQWYQEKALVKFGQRVEVSLAGFPDPERVRPAGLTVRPLLRRWGSMSRDSQLLLNRRLVEAPVDTIDYVITHELCHVYVPHHGPAFFELLGRIMPDWGIRKERLEQAMS